MVLCICGESTRQSKKHEITIKHTTAVLNFFQLRAGTVAVCLPCLQQGIIKFIPKQLVKLRKHFKNTHDVRVRKAHTPIGVISADYEYLLLNEPDLLIALIANYNHLWRESSV